MAKIQEITEERESVKLSSKIIERVRVISEREGYVLGRLVDRLIEAGLKAEKMEAK